MFVPLHARSACSLGFGVVPPASFARRAAEAGYRAMALTDVENLYGQYDFHRAAHAYGVKPIAGVQLQSPGKANDLFSPGRQRLVLLASNEVGYRSLCRVISRRRTASRTDTTPHPAAVAAHQGEGLFMLSDSPSILDELIGRGVETSRLRALIVRPFPGPAEDEVALRNFCSERGVRIVADPDIVLLKADDLALHELRVAIARGEPVSTVRHAADICDAERVFRPPDEVKRLYVDLPEALAESGRIADACSFDLLHHQAAPPGSGASGAEASAALATRCRTALAERIPKGDANHDRYRARLEAELDVLAKRGLSGYLVTVDEITREAHRRGIGLAARGSAGSSLAAYLLRISAVDPLAEGLLFERFLNPLRRDSPDVDLDVASDRRDELIGWVYERFGRERTATVGALHTIQVRTAYREGLRALGMPAEMAASFVRRIRDRPGDDEPPEVPTHRLPDFVRDYVPLIERLVGLPHHFSAHPGGIVIADEPIDALIPLERAEKGLIATQFDVRAVKQRGLVKIDLLGNRTLSELGMLERLVRRSSGPPFRWSAIPLKDTQAIELLNAAETIGCFQVESPAVRSVLRRMTIGSIGDVVVALALVRPGAGSGRAKDTYLRRARGLEVPTTAHPLVTEVLGATQGLLIFEEDIIRLIVRATGKSAAWSDRMRAAILRGDPDGHARRRFLEEASPTLGQAAAVVWGDLEKLAAYTFSRAHAASYAILAYYAAYAKAHHPNAFTCALIEHHGGLYPLRSLVSEMARRGVNLLAPSVNRSSSETTLEGGAVRVGLARIKHLRRTTIRRLLKERSDRSFTTVDDLGARLRPSKKELEALVLSGACDELAPLDSSAYPFAHERLLGAKTASPRSIDEDVGRFQSLVRIRNELRFLDMHVHAHPMQVLRKDADELGLSTTAGAYAAASKRVQVAGVVAAARIIKSAEGAMQFVTLEDETGTLECAVPPVTYRQIGNRIVTPGPFIASGIIREDLGDLHLEIDEMTPFHERATPPSSTS